MTTDEQIKRIAVSCGFKLTNETGDDLKPYVYEFARELIALAQQSTAVEPAQAVPVAWLPIETAPKDGAEILVTYGKQGFVMQLVRFDRTFNYWKSKGEAELGLENNATHWMPIPDPRKPLYTAPSAIDDETRKPLTDQEICDIALPFVKLLGGHWENEHGISESEVELFARAIEKAHGIVKE